MTAGLKHNIAMMRQTKQSPSFVQILVTFEEALAEIERLRTQGAHLADALEAGRREIERQRAALRAIIQEFPSDTADRLRRIASAALEGK